MAMVPDRFRIAAAFAAIYLVWGSTYLAIALALPAIPPFALMGSRSLVGGLILFAVARARGAVIGPRDWLVGGACGLLFFVGCHGVLAVAEQRVPSGLASILLATIPFWTVLIGLVLPLEKPTRPRSLALLAPGFAGVALIAWRELAGAGPALADILMLLGASLSWALGTVVSERHSGETPANALAGMALITGGLVLLGLAVATGELRRVDPAGLMGVPGLAWAHLTLAGTVVTFGAYVWLLERVSPPLVGTYTFVNPIVAVALGWAVLGEAPTVEMLAGGALVLGSLVALLLLDHRPRSANRSANRRRSRTMASDLSAPAARPRAELAAPSPMPSPPTHRYWP
jgi:drug/metabolite transporter (DMT)-like permease